MKDVRVAPPLLRSPPFPGADAAVARAGPLASSSAFDGDEIEHLFTTIREARIGGAFWHPPSPEGGSIIVRAATHRDADAVLAGLDATNRSVALCLLPDAAVDPWSLLTPGRRLIAHGDDEWVALAQIAGGTVRLLSAGRFGAPDEPAEALSRHVARELLGRRYRDPFTGEAIVIEEAVALLADWQRLLAANGPIAAACGMAWWKRREIGRFLWSPGRTLRFFRSEHRAIAHAARVGGAIAVWPSRISPGMAAAARNRDVALVRVEDGFVRSVGLGSDLVPPSSIAVDRLGIHYDPDGPSDLERLLAEADFPPPLLARAARLRGVILAAGIGKYGGGNGEATPDREPGRRLVLVPGQVEDDMSVRLGGGGLASNLELLRRVRAIEPDAEIWFRPHPDVDAGHRRGAVRDADALAHADRIVRGGGMAALLDRVDAVHVLTSLTGFEALLRERSVTCHGTPFYAGWGLTDDRAPVPARRGRKLRLDELIAGVLILYPRYLDPVTGLPCPPETLIRRMTEGTARNRLGWVSRLRRVQGRLAGLVSRRRGIA